MKAQILIDGPKKESIEATKKAILEVLSAPYCSEKTKRAALTKFQMQNIVQNCVIKNTDKKS